jgi:hypothetical protein
MDSALSSHPDSANGTTTEDADPEVGNIHPLDRLIDQLSQGEDYFHPATRVAWEISQFPISLKEAMLHRQTLSQLIEAAEMEEKKVRELVSELGRMNVTSRHWVDE